MTKKILLKIHLWLSLPLGVIIMLICLSGATLVFKNEIRNALGMPRVVAPHAKGDKGGKTDNAIKGKGAKDATASFRKEKAAAPHQCSPDGCDKCSSREKCHPSPSAKGDAIGNGAPASKKESSVEDEDVAKAALKQAKIDNGLKITGNESLDTTLHRSSHTKSENGIGVTASYPIYTSGKAEAEIDSSELGLKAAELSTERSRENLKLDVIKAYYDALEARRTVDVRQETVDKYQDHYTNVSQLYAAGSKARIDVIRSSVELSNAAQNLIKAQNSYEVNLATLRNYLNVDRSEPLNLTSDFSYDQFNIDMDACIDYAYRNRKDLLIDLYKYQQAENDIKAAKADFGPSVTLSAGPSWSHTFKPSTSSDSDITAGATLSWNFWDNGLTRAKVQQAEASRDKAKLTLTKDQEDIDLSLRQAY